MPRAIYNGQVIAETDSFELVEGNVYFPPGTVKAEFLQPSTTSTGCPWKGRASYHHVHVGDQIARDAAWYYPDPKPEAANIKDHIAFWRGVVVER